MRAYSLLMLAAAAVAGCATANTQQTGTAAGEVAIDSATLASTAVIRADNRHGSGIALFVRSQNGFDKFIGTVPTGSNDEVITLDPKDLPTGTLYILARDDGGDARLFGPYSATKGTVLRMTLSPILRNSVVTVR